MTSKIHTRYDRSRSLMLCVISSILLSAFPAFAQKAPQAGYVFPPVVRVGTASDVHFGGYDFTPDMQWFLHDEQITLSTSGTLGDYQITPPPYWIGPRAGVGALPLAREVAGRLVVAPSHPGGIVRWQVANANGSSQTATFYVSRGNEITESRSRDLPQRLPPLPVAVSGRLTRLSEVDRYEIVADQDGLISVELYSRRIGAAFNGMLQVRDSAGVLLADLSDTEGADGGVTFAAKSGETYTLALHDAEFRGDRSFVYRLAISRGPRVLCTLPAYGKRGTSREVEFIGVGVASGNPILESYRQTVSFPAGAEAIAHTHSLTTPFGTVDVEIPLSELDEQIGIPPQPQHAPLAITSVLPQEMDEQRFSWIAEKDEHWSLTLESRAIGGRLDVALAVVDPEGKQIAENDDLPGTTDAGLDFKAAASGVHTCIVRSMSSRVATPDEVFHLKIARSVPDFQLTVPQYINLPLGGKVELAVQVVRSAGFDGEIALAADALPAGVVLAGETAIPAGKNAAKLILQAAPDAAVVAGVIKVHGTARIGETAIVRRATAISAGNLCPRSPAEQRIASVVLAITMKPPFEVRLLDRTRQRDVHRGSTCLAEMEIVRKDGFSGEIQLEMAAAQSRYLCGSRGLTVLIPPESTRTVYPAWMSEHLGTEFTIRMATQGVATVLDPKGNRRYLTQPADAQITMIMEGALLKLSTPALEARLHLGESLLIPVSISRSAKLQIATAVELQVPDEINGLLHAEPVVLLPGRDSGELRITTVANDRLTGHWTLNLRATALQDGKWPVISEAELPLEITSK